MSGEGESPATNAYAELRRTRADRPAGGNFLSARNLKSNDIDVKVIGVEVRPGYKPPNSTETPEPEPYWRVTSAEVDGEALVKENAFMSDWLEDAGIQDPTGSSFRLIKTEHKGNPTFKVARKL